MAPGDSSLCFAKQLAFVYTEWELTKIYFNWVWLREVDSHMTKNAAVLGRGKDLPKYF